MLYRFVELDTCGVLGILRQQTVDCNGDASFVAAVQLRTSRYAMAQIQEEIGRKRIVIRLVPEMSKKSSTHPHLLAQNCKILAKCQKQVLISAQGHFNLFCRL